MCGVIKSGNIWRIILRGCPASVWQRRINVICKLMQVKAVVAGYWAGYQYPFGANGGVARDTSHTM